MNKQEYSKVDRKYLDNLIEDHVRDLQEQAQAIYEELGQSAVIEWAEGVGLAFSFCRECETETPNIGDCCGVCGVTKASVLHN